MTNPSLQIGDGNWAYKEDNLLGYAISPVNNKFLPREMTFTRASDGTRVNEDGLVENVPFNLLEQSNSFDTSPWSTANASVTGGQSGYDDSSDAWLIESTSANGRVDQSVSKSGVQTFSVYAKAGNSNWVRLRSDYIGANADAYFDLQNGVVGSSYNVITTQIDSVGNGWYRCSVVFNQSITVVRIYTTSANNSAGGSGNSAYIQDAQLNTGSTVKPYFPTTNRQDVPRIDYSSGTGALLLEPQRTNLVTSSEQFDNGAWGKNRCVATANTTTSPDGYINADTLTSNNSLESYAEIAATPTASQVAYSFFAKKNNANFVHSLAWDRVANGARQWFDIQNGTVGSSTTFGTGYSVASASIVDYGNGWFRCITIYNVTSGVTNGFRVSLSTANADTNSPIGTAQYFWGAQLEAGSYPTSYIPTTSSSVTRLADACYRTGISEYIGQTEGTIFVEINAIDVTDSRVTISDGTSSNRLILRIHFNGKIQWEGVQGGTDEWNIESSIGTIVSGSTYKIAAAYGTNNVALYANGTQIGVDNSAVVTSALSILRFANAAGGTLYHWNQYTKQAVLFKTRLSNTELAALTTL